MLSNTQIAQFREMGILTLPRFFSRAEGQQFGRDWQQLKQAMRQEGAPLTRMARFVLGALPAPLGEIYRDPRLVQVMNQLIGEDVAVYMNRMLVKDEQWNGAVAAHQDMPYFHGTTQKIAAFVPFGPFNSSTGGLSFVLGSHRYGNLGLRGTIQLDGFPHLKIETPAVEPGDILLMHFLTWHLSGEATVPSDRPVLQITYQHAADGTYFENGLNGPTLASGRWRTTVFFSHGEAKNAILPDHIPLAPMPAPEKPAISEPMRSAA